MLWPEFVSRLMQFLESFCSGPPRLTTLLFVVSVFLFIRDSDLLAFTVDHRLSIREGQSISGLALGYIFPDDVTRARLPPPSFPRFLQITWTSCAVKL
jgi:hypothetical protein